MNKKLLFLLAAIFVLQTDGYAAVSCPSGYVAVNEDVVYISDTNSCPSGHTKLGGEYGGDTIENCITALANGSGICTFFDTSCQSGKYFDGTSFKTCLAGTYCDGNGTAVPGTSGCSVSCPGNSTSASGATACTCNTGYNYNGGTTTTTNACVPNIYSVTYDCNGGTGGTTVSAIYNRDFTVQTGVCTRDGYEFDGWTMDGNDISGTFKWTYTSNKTLVAQWNECAVCNAGTGATCDMTVVDNTCTYTTQCMFGYDTLTGNGTNTPSCTATKYTITYDANGGKDVVSKTYTIEDAFTLPATTRDGYTFNGWTENGTAITQIVKGTTGNKTLVAQWNECTAGYYCPGDNTEHKCPDSYNSDTGAASEGMCYRTCTIACTQPVCPEKSENCVIIPSETSGEQYFGGECNATNRTCEFTFDCANGYKKSDDGLSCIVIEYDITYELNGGVNDESNPIKYNVETDTIILSAPKRSGYTFHGWYDNAEFAGEPVTQIVRASTSHKSFYAKWNECAIGYYCADGAQNKCPDGFSSNAGADSADDCNIKLQKLHIGNNTMYLTPNKPDTLPVMAFGIGDSVYYGGLSDSERTLHNDATIKYNIMLDGKQKYLYDLTAD